MKPTTKKRLIINYKNLNEKEKEAFEEAYSEGYTQFIQKIQKPDGSFLFVVPLETNDAIYMVKVDVRVDSKLSEEEFDKEILHTNKVEEDDQDNEQDEDKEDKSHFVLVHGDYADVEKDVETEAMKDISSETEVDDDDYIDEKESSTDDDDL